MSSSKSTTDLTTCCARPTVVAAQATAAAASPPTLGRAQRFVVAICVSWLVLATTLVALAGAVDSGASPNVHQENAINEPIAYSISGASGLDGRRHQSSQQQQQQQQQRNNLDKLQKYLNERQHALIKKHPGSLMAVTRALKMAIYECQYQMRYEPWNCPIYGFSIKPSEIFGMLISRSFKETSFIQSLISSALTHSVTRACTESTITTCWRRMTAHNTYSEDIEFGRHFAEQFMDATYDSPPPAASISSSYYSSANSVNAAPPPPQHHNNAYDSSLSSNQIVPTRVYAKSTQHHHQNSLAAPDQPPVWREREIRRHISAHNDEVGRLLVMYEMRRECKCHGLSGACTQQTCWLKLPPFRDVADKLHNSLEQAVKFYEAPKPSKRYKSMTSKLIKKSNKKRSSSSLSQQRPSLSSYTPTSNTNQAPPGRANGLAAGSTTQSNADGSLSGSGSGGGGFMFDPPISNGTHLAQQVQMSDNDVARGTPQHQLSSASPMVNNVDVGNRLGISNPNGIYHSSQNNELTSSMNLQTPPHLSATSTTSAASNSTYNVVKKRPIARSIGQTAHPTFPSMSDLLYYEESPDFCVPSERYNIKGTKDRICSEDPNESNSCKRLCCGRGYVTERREEKYKCECKFKYCCKLYCNQCTRRKDVHKCL